MQIAETSQAKLKRYTIERPLGAGGMGVVYLARDSKLQRQVAIKKLRRDIAGESASARIRSEARLLASLNHPNIVRLFDVLEEGGDIALVMEYVEGSTLKDWMGAHSAPLRDKLDLLLQICRGLGGAHALGIIHRDLKADNILISGGERLTAKITDFGIAKSLQQGEDLTREGHIAGSSSSMSPEQLQGQLPDPRSDLFSLGVIAYQLLCAQNPFGDNDSPYVTAERIVRRPHPPAAGLNPELPNALCQLLDSLLAKDPDKRPLSAGAVCAELEVILQSLDSGKSAPSGSRSAIATAEEFHQRHLHRGRRLTRFAAASAVLLFAAVAIALLMPQKSPGGDGKYIAILAPTDNPEQGAEARVAIQSALNAIKNGLSSRDGLYLVPYSESRKLRNQPMGMQARALNAQLLLKPEFRCSAKACELSLELIDAEQLAVIGKRSLSLQLNSTVNNFKRTRQQVNYLLPQYPTRDGDPILSVGEEAYRRFLELQARSFDYRTVEVTPETLRALEELQQKAPHFSPIYGLYGVLAFDNRFTNRNMDSVDRLEKFLALAPEDIANSAEVLIAKFYLANARYDWGASRRILTRLKSVMQDPANYYFMETAYHHLRGEYDQALVSIDRALALRTSTTYLMQKAVTLSYAGDMPAAKGYLQQVLELDSDYIDATSMLAANELDLGNADETIRLLGSIEPERLSAVDVFNLCSAHFLKKNFHEADRCFADRYTTLPDDLEPLLYRAEIARELGQPERARQLAEQVRELARAREGWENQLMLALAYAQLGQSEKAVATLLKIRQQAPDDIYTNHARAQVYITTGDLVSTKAHIRKTLELGQSPLWYQTSRFAKICSHADFADLRAEYPALCAARTETQVTRK